MNRALEDFIKNDNAKPVLVFRVNNSSVVPAPSVSDPLQFDWKACVMMDIVAKSKVTVPNPF